MSWAEDVGGVAWLLGSASPAFQRAWSRRCGAVGVYPITEGMCIGGVGGGGRTLSGSERRVFPDSDLGTEYCNRIFRVSRPVGPALGYLPTAERLEHCRFGCPADDRRRVC